MSQEKKRGKKIRSGLSKEELLKQQHSRAPARRVAIRSFSSSLSHPGRRFGSNMLLPCDALMRLSTRFSLFPEVN
jgi:hypothetical protein